MYQKVYVPRALGAPSGQFGVTIGINPITGEIAALGGFTQFITATLSSSRIQATTFEVMAPFATNFTKL